MISRYETMISRYETMISPPFPLFFLSFFDFPVRNVEVSGKKRTSLGPENLGRWVSWKTEEMVTFCQVCYDESYIYIYIIIKYILKFNEIDQTIM